jgi:hypothetical protein
VLTHQNGLRPTVGANDDRLGSSVVMLGDGSDSFAAPVILVVSVGRSGVGGSSSWWRMSLSSRVPVGAIVMPRQPREARSSTAHTRFTQLTSPGSRPITFTRRRVSPKVRSMKLECRIRRWCSTGYSRPSDALTG